MEPQKPTRVINEQGRQGEYGSTEGGGNGAGDGGRGEAEGAGPPAGRARTGARWVWAAAAAGWLGVNLLVLGAADERLPFDWPARSGRTTIEHLVDANAGLIEVLLLMGLVLLLTRRHPRPDVAARIPDRARARRETLGLLAYGVVGLAAGYGVARAFGWHPFGFHLAGTLYGTHASVGIAEAVSWALFNLVVFAALPLWWFRRRYSAEQLCLRSANRRADTVLILTVLVFETTAQLVLLRPEILQLDGRDVLVAAPAAFALYFAGAVLPSMVFVYALLLPRLLRLTGSPAATVVLGGLAYTAVHLWDAWTRFGTTGDALLSSGFLILTYAAPGMLKAVLTLRTGNAWVHVWAYHALAPHTLADTPHVLHIMR